MVKFGIFKVNSKEGADFDQNDTHQLLVSSLPPFGNNISIEKLVSLRFVFSCYDLELHLLAESGTYNAYSKRGTFAVTK